MTLLIYYIILSLLLDGIAIAISFAVEQVSQPLSMPVFLALFFGSLWLAWVIAVRMTEPKPEAVAEGVVPHDQLVR